MKTLDLFIMAFMNLWRRKLRAFLTVLGMVIGVASIVVMVSLGIGINESFRENYERAGSLTTIEVNTYRRVEKGDMVEISSSQDIVLDDKSVLAFRKIPGVTAVMPIIEAYGALKSGQYATDIPIMGIDLKVAEEFGFKLANGRMPNANAGSKYELVIGAWALNNFWNPTTGKSATDREGNSKISLERSRFQLTFDYSNIYSDWETGESRKGRMYDVKVVGQMAEEGNNYAYYSLMDVAALRKLAKENKDFTNIDTKKYNQVWVKCENLDEVLNIKEQIEEMGYGTYSLQDALQAAQESAAQLQMLLGAIGGVSLLVAAIGIMNTMMMSIYERTKEIGIIKVLGCRMRNIAELFLTEAAYIGLIGGLIGLGISYGLSSLLNNFVLESVGMRSVIPLYLSLGAVAFSIVVALISGMYPAIRAMKLSALSAIRSE